MSRPRRKYPYDVFLRAALRLGANEVLRKAGFKRPGGGWSFLRTRGEGVSERLDAVVVERRRGCVTLQLRVSAPQHLRLTERGETFPVDVPDGDFKDLAVWVNHWLRSEALPWFDVPVDLEALAREEEQRRLRPTSDRWEVARIAALWRLAGRDDEAVRVEAAAAREEARLRAEALALRAAFWAQRLGPGVAAPVEEADF